MTLAEFGKDFFSGQIGRRFRVEDSEEGLAIELIEVTRLDAPEPRPFSLTFRGPLTPLLPQSIHRLAGEGHEPLELFLVPIGPDREGKHLLYEAVFN